MTGLLSSKADSPRLNRRDRWAVLLLTLFYTVFALLNLGTTCFPESGWEAAEAESAVLDLGAVRDVACIRVNRGISEGTLCFTGDDGSSYALALPFSDARLCVWTDETAAFSTRYLKLTASGRCIRINEVAFLDADGNILPVISADESGAALVDEQDTVPDRQTCLNGMYFDEIYHARTAYEFLHGMEIYETSHPHLGKLVIALGICIFGMTPFGWRFMPTLFGAAMLPVLYILAKRLFRRSDFSFCAAALLALDTMHFAQSRIATLDGILVFFILLMYLFMTDYLQTDLLTAPLKKQLCLLGACGISFGLGVAVKWPALFAGVGLALLFFGKLIVTGRQVREDADRRKRFRSIVRKTLLFCCGAFLLLPAVIYYLSYLPFYRFEAARAAGVNGFSDSLRILTAHQKQMFGYHSGLVDTHPFSSNWYEWPFSAKYVAFYMNTYEQTDTFSELDSIGSPGVWWVAAIGAFCLCTEAAFGGFRRAGKEKRVPLAVLLVAMAANYFPWIAVTRITFLYHFFPTLPFMILSALLILQKLEEDGELPVWVKWAWLGFAGVYFVLLYPLASGLEIPKAYYVFLARYLPSARMLSQLFRY